MRRVDFPRMDVEHHRTAFRKHLPRHLANQPIREQPQIPSTKETRGFPQHVGNGNRDLQQPIIFADAVRFAPPLRHAAVSPLRRKHRGIVMIAGLRQRIEEPRRLVSGRKARRTVTYDFDAREVLQQQARFAYILVDSLRPSSYTDGVQSRVMRPHVPGPQPPSPGGETVRPPIPGRSRSLERPFR